MKPAIFRQGLNLSPLIFFSALTLLQGGMTSSGPAALADPGAASTTKLADRIVAVVNGEVITLSEVEETKLRMRSEMEELYAIEPDAVPFQTDPVVSEREALNLLIERKIQVQLAKKRGITVDPQEVEQLLQEIKTKNGLNTDQAFKEALAQKHLTPDQYREDVKEQLMILKLAGREVKSGILLDDKELLDYYQSHLEKYSLPEEVHLRQILLKVSPAQSKEGVLRRSLQIAARSRNGEDFSSLARELSQGPEARDGGNLGFLKRDQLMPEVQRAIADKNPGEVTDPVETSSGIHLFFVEEIRGAQHRPFEEVKPILRDDLFQERAAQRYQEWLKEIRSNAQVDVRF